MIRKFFTPLFVLFTITCGFAQSELYVDTSPTAEQMVLDFFANSDVTPTNITFNGAPVSVGYFEAANTDLGVTAGIILSTGNAAEHGKVAEEFSSSATGGDPDVDLAALAGGLAGSYDAAVLEFDIIATVDFLDFQYVFGSEEYPDFTSSTFTDVFGFLVSGSGMPNPNFNIAVVPGTSAPVSIGNINDMNNPQYYVPYLDQDGQHVVFNGLTTVLSAPIDVVPQEVYHVKIGVTDIGDAVYDSAIFLDVESLNGSNLVNPPAIFSLSVDENMVSITNDSRYATSYSWDFGDGTTSTERYPAPHEYAAPGTYTVTLTTQNYCCTDTYTTEVQIGTTSTTDLVSTPFRLSPNPASDLLQIQLEDASEVSYQLHDALGQQVLQGNAAGSTQLDVRALNPGVYFLTVRHQNGNFTEKVMVTSD